MAPRLQSQSEKDPARGARLREARQARGLTVEQLADELSVTARIVRGWEKGEPIPVRGRGAVALERALKRPLRYLHTGVEDYGTRIATLRLEKGWTQVDLSRRVGIGVQEKKTPRGSTFYEARTIQDWETALRPFERIQGGKRERLALALGVSVDYLATGEKAGAPRLAESDDEWTSRFVALEAQVGRILEVLPEADRRRSSTLRGERKERNELTELREDVNRLTQAIGDLGSQVLALQEQQREAEGRRETGSSEDAGSDRP